MSLGFRILLLSVIVLVGYLIYNACITKPKALSFSLNDEEGVVNEPFFWDLEKPIKVKITAQKGVKSYMLKAVTEDNLVLYEKENLVLDKPKTLEVPLVKPEIMGLENKRITYEIEANDWSYANFFNGNKASFKREVSIDTTKPLITILSHSPSIAYGGSALVVFEAIDRNLSKVFVRVKKRDFEAFRLLDYQKRHIFVALVPWSYEIKDFKAFIVAKDKANNSSTTPLLLKRKTHHLKEKDIDIALLKNKILKQGIFQKKLSESNYEQALLEMLSTARQKDLANIEQMALKQGMFYSDFSSFQAFMPFNEPFKITGHFLESRRFLKDTQVLFKFFHLGVDLRPKKDLSLAFNNAYKRVFKGKLDFYGDSLLNCYGLGLCAFFTHLNPFSNDKEVLGNSGLRLAYGLHFGMLLQGVFVRPNEWLNQKWINTNIITPLEQARRILTKE
ncbi:M23 family metallopeptidase [Helicobacter cetorum]|uniref:Metalloendopeptidase related membrane protein n=1 Tax=Helicobacter cetorum (strain ATCC BAA-540 / CCUG 52418 / MIT 99-5656) TaxID=1163745 RepID=I0EUJ3_HELCM|nr:M23 family metallopeptidase [Helicobacter cetorum]AFI06612.1 metalloendopeptidase related membrane protein [Helicobacter cetorum MIT 99-5656]